MHQFTAHKSMEITMDTEADIITIEDIKETTPTEAEGDSKTTKPMENQSIRMREATCFLILMDTPLMHPSSSIQLLLFNPQLWKLPKLTEAEEPQEVTEDPIEDEDSDKTEAMIKDLAQVEEQIGEHKEETTTDKDHIKDSEEDRNIIEDLEEDKNLIEDKDSMEAQGEVQTKDREVEDLHSLIVTIGTAWYAKREDTITYFSAPSFRTIFQEVIMSYQSPKKYVDNASQQLAHTIPVVTHTQKITRIGSVTYTN